MIAPSKLRIRKERATNKSLHGRFSHENKAASEERRANEESAAATRAAEAARVDAEGKAMANFLQMAVEAVEAVAAAATSRVNESLAAAAVAHWNVVVQERTATERRLVAIESKLSDVTMERRLGAIESKLSDVTKAAEGAVMASEQALAEQLAAETRAARDLASLIAQSQLTANALARASSIHRQWQSAQAEASLIARRLLEEKNAAETEAESATEALSQAQVQATAVALELATAEDALDRATRDKDMAETKLDRMRYTMKSATRPPGQRCCLRIAHASNTPSPGALPSPGIPREFCETRNTTRSENVFLKGSTIKIISSHVAQARSTRLA
jgi:hypothetical protein